MDYIDNLVNMISEKCDNEKVDIKRTGDNMEWEVSCKCYKEYGFTVLKALENLYEEVR